MGAGALLPAPGQPSQGADPTYSSPAIPNLVSFGFEEVTPPTSFYVQRDDVLVLQGVTQLGSDTLVVSVRLLLPFGVVPGQPDAPNPNTPQGVPLVGPGYIETTVQALLLPSKFNSQAVSIPLSEGYLLSITIRASNAGQRGQTFARAFLNRGPLVNFQNNVTAVMAAGYVTNLAPISWPFYTPEPLAYERGAITTYTPANPGAGADINFISNGAGRVRFSSFFAQFVASGVAGNRFVSFILSNTTAPIAEFVVQDTVAITTGQTVSYSLGPSCNFVRGGGTPAFVTMPTPDDWYGEQGIRIQSLTQGLLAGDQWSAISVATEEWMETF